MITINLTKEQFDYLKEHMDTHLHMTKELHEVNVDDYQDNSLEGEVEVLTGIVQELITK